MFVVCLFCCFPVLSVDLTLSAQLQRTVTDDACVVFFFFCEPASLLLIDRTRQHQLSDEQRRKKSKCERVDDDKDHY